MQRHVVIVYHEVGSTKAQLVQQLAVETGAFFKKEKAEQNRTKQKKNKTKKSAASHFIGEKNNYQKSKQKFQTFLNTARFGSLGPNWGTSSRAVTDT